MRNNRDYHLPPLIVILAALAGTAGYPLVISANQQTAAERYDSLLKTYDAPLREYLNNDAKTKPACQAFLQLAREHPKDAVAIDALNWVVTHALFSSEAAEAMELLARYHAENARMGPIIQELDRLYGDPFGAFAKLLREVLNKNPHRDAQAEACFVLACELKNRREKFDRDRLQHNLFTKGENVPFVETPQLTQEEIEKLEKESHSLFGVIVKKYDDIKRGDRLLSQLAESESRLAIGSVAPEIDGEDADGERFELGEYRGKIVVLTFSANWCGPCRARYPENRRLVDRFRDQPFALLSVNADHEKETLKQSLEKGEMTWRCWWDGGPEGPNCTRWNVSTFPTTYVLDAKGRLRFKNADGKVLEHVVELLLKESQE